MHKVEEILNGLLGGAYNKEVRNAKQQFISSCEVIVVLLTFYAIFDLMFMLFNIVSASKLLQEK